MYRVIYHTNELKHFGVLGMKWGVRKFDKGVRKLGKIQTQYNKRIVKSKGVETMNTAALKIQAAEQQARIQQASSFITKQLAKKNWQAVRAAKRGKEGKVGEKISKMLQVVNGRPVYDMAATDAQSAFKQSQGEKAHAMLQANIEKYKTKQARKAG